jgi:hypothetical protein
VTKLLLAPHGDDEVLFACFTLLRHRPHTIICTRAADDYETRQEETSCAMDLLGIDWTQIPISAANPDWEQVEVYLNGWNSDPYQDVFGDLHVWAPAWEPQGHEQHNAVADLAVRVFGADNVTHYLTYKRGHGHSKSEHEVPYEPEWLAWKFRALACYESQIIDPDTRPWFQEYLDLREWYA